MIPLSENKCITKLTRTTRLFVVVVVEETLNKRYGTHLLDLVNRVDEQKQTIERERYVCMCLCVMVCALIQLLIGLSFTSESTRGR